MNGRETAARRRDGCLRGTAPEVPGHETVRRLGEGASSTVWLVRRREDDVLLAARVAEEPEDAAAAPGGGPPVTGSLGSLADALGPVALDHLARAHGQATIDCPDAGHRHRVALMDYLPGGSLAQVVAARGPLSPGETVTVITPLAQLLAAGHAAGVTHGDVSPGNVLFTIDGRPVLTDWELAGRPGRPGPAGAGTDGFRDPSAGAADRLRPASDVYATAALAWFCLTGRVPGPVEHRPPLPVLVPEAPRSLALLLDRAMDPDPSARPGAAELARGVFVVATPEPVDLHASAHASVRPELVTRREAPARGRPRRSSTGAPRTAHRGMHQHSHPRGTAAGPAVPATGPGSRPAPRGAFRAARPNAPAGGRRRVLAVAFGVVVAGTLGGVAALVVPATPGWFAAAPVPAANGPAPSPGTDPSARAVPGTTGPTAAAPGRAATVTPRSSSSPGSSPGDSGAAGAPDDPVVAARALTEVRTRAFRDGRWDLLAAVTVPGSPAALADRAAAAGLVDGAGRLSGLAVEITCGRRIGTAAEAPGRALVLVCARFTPYRQVDRGGRVVRSVAPSPDLRAQLQLVRAAGGWRIEQVRAVDG